VEEGGRGKKEEVSESKNFFLIVYHHHHHFKGVIDWSAETYIQKAWKVYYAIATHNVQRTL
jgi:hypothetical protein|tara:strand:+ start:375 stop:557 length:183 start_codon:yes stop_codon:yes gene_type:complete